MRSFSFVVLMSLAFAATAMAAPARPEMGGVQAKTSAEATAPQARRLVVPQRRNISVQPASTAAQPQGACDSILCSKYIVIGF